jgi:predicted cation transporter
MIIVIIFYLHVLAAVLAFTSRWQEEGLHGGFVVLGFMGLIFAVGWTMVGLVMHYIAPRGIPKVIDADSMSLLLLIILEGVIYYFYFFSDGNRKDNQQAKA